jgi:hypothetical protein
MASRERPRKKRYAGHQSHVGARPRFICERRIPSQSVEGTLLAHPVPRQAGQSDLNPSAPVTRGEPLPSQSGHRLAGLNTSTLPLLSQASHKNLPERPVPLQRAHTTISVVKKAPRFRVNPLTTETLAQLLICEELQLRSPIATTEISPGSIAVSNSAVYRSTPIKCITVPGFCSARLIPFCRPCSSSAVRSLLQFLRNHDRPDDRQV